MQIDPKYVLEALGITRQQVFDACVAHVSDECSEFDGDSLAGAVKSQIIEEKHRNVLSSIENQLPDIVKDIITLAFDDKYQVTDSWGKAKGEPISVRELIRNEVTKYFESRVDDRGGIVSKNSYNYENSKTRVTWMAEQAIREMVNGEMKKEVNETLKMLREQFSEAFKNALGEVGKSIAESSVILK